MDEIKIGKRVEFLQDSYVSGDLTEEEFETFVEAALDEDSPFFYDWFQTKLETNEARHKRYANEQIYVYDGDEYEVDGKQIVEIEDSEDIDRTISVTDTRPNSSLTPLTKEEDVEPSDEVKEKQEELRDQILGR